MLNRLFAWLVTKKAMTERGYPSDIVRYVDRLLRSTDEYSFLVIGVSSTDFLQMKVWEGIVQLDFPLVTPRQKEREKTIKSLAQIEGLTVVENLGSDGSRFLDIDVQGSATNVAALAHRMLKKLFDVNDDTVLRFEFDRLAE